ncbi:MAG: glycosyltransferase family 4 protein [Alphaproteobacteria bacterium]|nr:glycosyltransferase family 4 protein [Alphaproteobacteria bacterium]
MLKDLQFRTFDRKTAPALPRVCPARKRGRLAYLTSQYPKVSHTFIRREIQAMERQGWDIVRLAVRGWDAELVDPEDKAELPRTIFALKGGAGSLLLGVMQALKRQPIRFFATLRLALLAIRCSDKPMAWHVAYFAEACWFANTLTNQNVSHLHVHFGSNPAEVAMLISALTGISYSITIHGPEEFDRARAIRLREKVGRAAFVVAISFYCRSQLLRNADMEDWPKISVIRCGLPRDYVEAGPVIPSAQARLVCIGRLCEQKGQLLLAQAAAALAAEGREFKLVIVGDGDDRPVIEQQIAKYSLGNIIEITGWAHEARVRSEILAARALVLPSLAEGLPIALMEAMRLGRPVLTTYVAGIPELVTPETGWLFPAGSTDDLVNAMRACLDSTPEHLLAMGMRARERVQLLHDLDAQARSLSALFEAILEGTE